MNKTIDRRQLLAFFGVGAAAVGLEACAGSSLTSVPAFVTAIDAVGAEAQAVVPMLKAADAQVPSQAVTYVQDIVDIANGIGSASTQAQGQSALNQIVTFAEDLAPIIVPLASAAVPGAGPALGLIVASLPAIAALLNVTIAQFSPLLQQLASQAPAPTASVVLLRSAVARPSSQDYLNELIARHS